MLQAFQGESREWAEFARTFHDAAAASKDGTGIYFLSTTITSPTLARQWKAVVPCALAAAAPMLAAYFVIDRLGYTDAGTKFMAVGVNPLA